MKKDCPKYAACHSQKGKFVTFVCSEFNLVSVPTNTWWVDSSVTSHTTMSMQGYLWSRQMILKDSSRWAMTLKL